ncbi:MAG: RpiB/LacA/LacB family sugar-phosphate isomerase [Bacteroidales bacterium]|jgi:ribose 5-phosphate isomerase B|nr:RpiB/LacA/LacB family sugar-phosphate isomerase [Bacteroidales bacterium]
MKIGIANDHAGYALKLKLKDRLQQQGFFVRDFGCSSETPVDYADFAHPLANAVVAGECDLGISICGSGNGINMTVNKHAGIRGALCWTPEISRLARAHNNANICSLPARFISEETAFAIADIFLHTPFEGGRHQRRIDKITPFL